MNWVFSSIIGLTVIQLILGKQLHWWLLLVIVLFIVRLLFLLRSQGIVVKSKPLWITEAVIIFFEVVLSTVSKKPTNWVVFVFYVLLSAIVIVIELLDDKFYVYKVEDEKLEEKE